MKKKPTKPKGLDNYLEPEASIQPKTVRAPSTLWARVDALADRQGVSLNRVLIAILEKACDDAGVV